jgi:hypothetical protein
MHPAPVAEGVSDQRLQTRGGERWPDHGSVGDAALAPGGPSRIVLTRVPRITRAPLTAVHAGMVRCAGRSFEPTAVDRVKTGSYGGRVLPSKVSPPGAMRSKPQNTARGTPWDLADLRLYKRLDKPRCREASRPVGPSRPRASRAPSVLFR